MKRASGFAWALAAAATVSAAGCGCRAPAPPKFGRIPKGAEVSLMLIKDLQSGADAVGTIVPFMCKADVVDASGNVVIAKGAVAYGKVVRSQGAAAHAGRGGGPIGLDVSIDDVGAVDGQRLKLSVVRSGLQTSPLALDAKYTALIRKSSALDAAWAKPDVHKDLVKLAQLIGSSKNSDLSDNPASAGLLCRISAELGLPDASKLPVPDVLRVASIVGQIATGRIDLGGQAQASRCQTGAVIELTQVVGYVEDRLGAPAPRTIRARIGLPFAGYVIEEAKVRLPAGG